MTFKPTKEQSLIIEAVNDKVTPIIAIQANSGSAKTSSLLMSLQHDSCWFKSGLFLAFNKKIAMENAKKVPNYIECVTLHSLAYKYIVRPLRLKVKNNIQESDFNHENSKVRNKCVWLMNKFCTSRYTKLDEFFESMKNKPKSFYKKLLKDVIIDMEEGKKPIPHSVYMKLFHLHLASGSVDMPEYDLLFLDEAGDINGVYLEVFLLINAKKKVATGDSSQNIYGFNHTLNGLEILVNEYRAKEFSLSKTFRCSHEISKTIQSFCDKYIDDEVSFIGTKNTLTEPKTFMFLTRGNRELLEEIYTCMLNDTKFSLARDANAIFDLLIWCKSTIYNIYEEYKETNIEPDIPQGYEYIWKEFKDAKANRYSFSKWVKERAKDDKFFPQELIRTIELIRDYSSKDLISMKQYCKDRANKDSRYTLGTVFSTKGLEADCVYIGDSLNKSMKDYIMNPDEYTDETEAFLYYTGCTRAKKWLINAEILRKEYIGNDDYSIVDGSNMNYGVFKRMIDTKDSINEKFKGL